ncbi:DNA mismatch repair protein MutS [Anaerocolumna aminovalerica]|jgi:DNA mismatch repair protein MutS|uniref:DNA mismatch repair protein MutS n=1 Tax=Anaerocolumna aminovalerica TaxID=1527 RepID=A0A1I5CJR3_9FIRM|nr:DNA mismatch repair protein MutS [Anaerocolumna aminovalerica]MBU5332614.1 DNA mismatch repair protein MutS [Anaerocolumna aminovalerica]MDU6264988.1 DNA mismatch repair protein MutS [Anaerocolumna aminovalerica]SFN87102.1 DNA mismatch repair protein MutS [Anaerocolumna aminovalerica]
MAELTPMMQQYMEIKSQYKDCILFYRLGDFYEMFFEDAQICSKELEITLTGKNCGLEERAPMCGIPYHAVDGYLSKLISRGYHVAICEQVEDPKAAKGIVRREVIRIVTPGTNINPQALDESKNNYLMGIVHTTNAYGISTVDVTTGDFYVTEVDSDRKLLDEITKFNPSEIICNNTFLVSGVDIDDLKSRLQISISNLESWYFDDEGCVKSLKEHFNISSLDGLGLGDYSIGVIASGAVLQYLYETQKNSLTHLTKITPYVTSKYMLLDSSTRRNLELTETLREKQKRGSLLWVLDKTKTAMGARLLRNYLEQPLIDKKEINIRLDAIAELNDSVITREEIREYLNPIYDLERLMGRISYKSAGPRDLIAFKSSLSMLPHIKVLLNTAVSDLLKNIYNNLDALEDLYHLIETSIVEEPPITVREGGIIKDGFHEEVDKLRKAKTEGKTWLAQLESREKEKTGIKNLKIKFNKVFGYYLEVTNSYQNLVPENWIRKQTLTNAERYTTSELKELEDVILGAEDKLFSLEYDLFCEVREKIAAEVSRIQQTAKAVAKLDVFTSLALVAERNNFTRPAINEEGVIDIKDGRHPVVEKMISNDMFVANDTYLDNKEKRISIITGPNMAGKSTYMRQTALIVLMAQVGSFVPASYANIGIADRIFTRVGASDDLASGQSTFMVEMTEVANILRNATKNSLLILDEIGRGTSTFDGLSIAWAVVEHISNPKLLGAKTLFATHYHELTELEGKLDSVNNYCIAVKEQGEDIVFLRKIVKGGADKSYGIQVAKLAGVPENVLKRASEIVEELSQNDITEKARAIADSHIQVKPDVTSDKDSVAETELETGFNHKGKKKHTDIPNQMSFFDFNDVLNPYEDIIKELKTINLNSMTPMDAMNKIYELQQKVK